MSENIIEVEHVTAGYPDAVILDDVSFSVKKGEIFILLGGSGCGKSTIMKHMIGLNPVLGGRLTVSGASFSELHCGSPAEPGCSAPKCAPAVLRKDFLLSADEIDVSYRSGADAVLLIVRILDCDTIVSMAKRAADYQMTSLVEVRSDDDLEKLKLVASSVDKKFIVCGVNSRDLATFKIDLLKPCSMMGKIRSIWGDGWRVIF